MIFSHLTARESKADHVTRSIAVKCLLRFNTPGTVATNRAAAAVIIVLVTAVGITRVEVVS